jgi:hypothetical protein
MTDLDALLARARLTAEHGAPVLLPPAEALALVAEVERLRAQVADFRLMIDGLETAAHEERADAVAHLRAQAEMAYDNTDAHHALWLAAEDIERGEHRRKEKP